MSDTPRTDAYAKEPSTIQETWAIARDWALFARTLERELAEALADKAALDTALSEVAALRGKDRRYAMEMREALVEAEDALSSEFIGSDPNKDLSGGVLTRVRIAIAKAEAA